MTSTVDRPPSTVNPSVVTVGTFDGVHRGHALVIRRVIAEAKARGLRSVIVTFDPHPVAVLNPAAAPPMLTVGGEKTDALSAFGADEVAVVPFTKELAALEAEQFVDQILISRFGMNELLIGHDHGLGRGRTGDAATLRRLGEQRGFGVHVVPPVEGKDGKPVSSTLIRRALAGGDLSTATDGLGRLYSVSGPVVHGDARGATLGFRTINIDIPPAPKLLPPDGIYAVRATTPDGKFGGMLSLGGRPTFGDDSRRIEAHLFDAAGDWYGATVRIEFVAWLRGIATFDGPDALVKQLQVDEVNSRAVLARQRAGL
jgi:riboflavin kinase/FMN adenylyltransferase